MSPFSWKEPFGVCEALSCVFLPHKPAGVETRASGFTSQFYLDMRFNLNAVISMKSRENDRTDLLKEHNMNFPFIFKAPVYIIPASCLSYWSKRCYFC